MWVSDGSPVSHSAADGFPLLEDASTEALGLLLHRRYGINRDVERRGPRLDLLAKHEPAADPLLGGLECHVGVTERLELPAEESRVELLCSHEIL